MVKKLTTRDYLDRSAIELLSSNNIEQISVRDICKNCGLSTRTFYKYYRDKYDIINSCFNSYLDEFYNTHAENPSLHSFMRFTAGIVYEQRSFFSHVFRYTGQNNIRQALVQPLKAHYCRLLRECYHAELTEERLRALDFFIRGQLAYVEDALTWVEIPDADRSVAFFENALPAVLLPYLQSPSIPLSKPEEV